MRVFTNLQRRRILDSKKSIEYFLIKEQKFMSVVIDARGLSCPQPIVRAKKAVDEGISEFEILVSDDASKENLKKFADNSGYAVESIVVDSGAYRIKMKKTSFIETKTDSAKEEFSKKKALLIASDRIGRGSDELGSKLLLAFIYTLTELEKKPGVIILMQSGVRLATEEPQAIENLKKLTDSGTDIILCGTCLDYFGLKEKVAVGRVSNMYEIAEILLTADIVSLP